MKVNKLLLKLFVITTIFSTIIFARSEMSGMLHTGEKTIVKPQNHHALSITKSKGKFSSNASYNVTLMNSGDIIYEDKNQVDDIYLVFHDDVLDGDRMKIEVNRGYFDYKITSLLSLPKIVKNVLEPEVLQRAKNNKVSKKKPKKKVAPKKVKPSPIIEKEVEEVLPVQVLESDESKVAVPVLQSDISYESPIGKSFFEKFTKIFEELVETFSFKPTTKNIGVEEEVKKEIQKSEKPSIPKSSLPTFNDDALRSAAGKSETTFSGTKRGIDTGFNDSALRDSATIEESAFSTSKRGLRENFDDSALQMRAKESQRVFTKPKEIAVDSSLPSIVEAKFSGVRSRTPMLYQEDFSKQAEQVPTFKTMKPIEVKEELKSQIEPIPSFTNPVREVAPIVEQPAQKVVLQEAMPVQMPVNTYVATPQQQVPLSNDITEAYPDTGYKEGYEALAQRRSTVVQKPVRQRVVEDTSLPQSMTMSSADKDEKLVITKIIDKQEPADPFAGRVLGRMDDRVMGNGYNGAAISAKLGMRVTKNSRPVSAWVEVFKNGTKQRVKTFYTSKGRKTKKVKLPAGNYMVRATYRTRDSKQQKTIKNIRLAEGGNVNKSIAFHDGKLRVVAMRGDDPLYVKVVAYKSGSRQRVSYDFSSRTSGVAELSLVSGTYDIEVIDHKNNRAFDSIRIRAGKTNTINADF